MPTPTQPQPLSPDVAYATIHQRVYAPVFFTKLAQAYNIRPRNEQEATMMLQQAAQLRAEHDAQTEKQSNDMTSLLARSGQHLTKTLSGTGSNQNDDLVKRAAAELSGDAELAKAVLSLQTQAA